MMMGKRFGQMGLLVAVLAAPPTARGDGPPLDAAALRFENEQLRKEAAAQEARLQRLQHDLDDARASMIQAKFQVDALEHRCKKLHEELLQLRSGKGLDQPADLGPAKVEPQRGKPPVLGKITEIGKDGRLLQISLGLEAGVKQGQVLEVFRLATRPTQRSLYLGTLTLIRVDPQAALGQFKSVGGLEYRPVVGDDVSSELSVK
jgi:hypothetical protein